MGGGGRQILYLSLHCHHQKDSCIKMGSDESHLNVSLSVTDTECLINYCEGQNHKTVSTNHSLLEDKGEPKRDRTEALSNREPHSEHRFPASSSKLCQI